MPYLRDDERVSQWDDPEPTHDGFCEADASIACTKIATETAGEFYVCSACAQVLQQRTTSAPPSERRAG